MALFSAICSCFMRRRPTLSRVSEDAGSLHKSKVGSLGKHEKQSSKSSGAPIVVPHFPVNLNISRL
ncbi:hypothetical protein RHSIM_Rhsim07G0052900 [Rhododendron simsii]|nr:hypothetical protein RHSIM_Rhsim07G0052900 [Rhododendron simsii]